MAGNETLSRPARKVLVMLARNGGIGIYKAGSASVMVIGQPGDQHAAGPSSVLTAIARRGMVLLGDFGVIHLTDEGRAELARLGMKPRDRAPNRNVLGDTAGCVMDARNALDEIPGDGLQMSAEIPRELRARLHRLKAELAETSADLFALARPDLAQVKHAA